MEWGGSCVTLRTNPRPKKCGHCLDRFTPARMGQKACSPKCALSLARSDRETRRKRETREARQRLKTLGELTREAQGAFNAWVRARDHDQSCISCGRFHQGQWHAGHYRTTAAAPELRFEPLNVHRQCAPCNNHKSGNLIEYRIRLIEKIGQDQVDWLEGPHEPKRYTRDDLQSLKAKYRKMARELIKNQENA